MKKIDQKYNKDFIFGITLTELIITLFFLLLLLTALITMMKDFEIKDLLQKNKVQTQEIKDLNRENAIQEELATMMVNEVLKHKAPQYRQKATALSVQEEVKTIFRELTDQSKLVEENSKLKSEVAAYKKNQELQKMAKELQNAIEIKSQLIKNLNNAKSIVDLKKLINELEECKTEILKIKEELKKSQKKNAEFLVRLNETESALKSQMDLKDQITANKALMKKLASMDSKKELEEFINDCKENKITQDCQKENTSLEHRNKNLAGQVKYLSRRLNVNGGNELPPCWVDANTGKPEYIFKIYINENDLSVEKYWPNYREVDVDRFKNIDKVVSSSIDISLFMQYTREIYLDSVKQECKHFVQLYDRAVSKNGYKDKRLRIENYFYKYENNEK